MPPFDLRRRAAAEAIGTAFLVATVVGSGMMAERLTADTAVALLANSLATGAILAVAIALLAPVSGAHFNPAVSLAMALSRRLAWPDFAIYCAAQAGGALIGTIIAHLMFEMAPMELSQHIRTGPGQWLAELVASFGLVAVILTGAHSARRALPWLVALYIAAAYWFTASTSFANPAVTLARAFTDSFAGIRPLDVPPFIVAQFAGALLALAACRWLLRLAPARTAAIPDAEPQP